MSHRRDSTPALSQPQPSVGSFHEASPYSAALRDSQEATHGHHSSVRVRPRGGAGSLLSWRLPGGGVDGEELPQHE